MDVHLRHLRWFVALADDLHFGRTAQRLHITQSALSKLVARLEKDIGAPLLQRTSRSVTLTSAGRAFRDAAIRTLDDANEAVTAARDAAGDAASRLRIGYVVPIGDVLTALLETLKETAPFVQVELCNFPYSDISAGLRDGHTDAAFTVPHLDIAELGFLPLFTDERVLLLPASHPLACRSAIDLDDLAALDSTDVWLLPPGPPIGSDSFRRFWSGADALDDRSPPHSLTFTSNEDMAQLIAAGRGLGLGFRCLVNRYTIPGIVALPVAGLPPGSVGLAWRRSRTSPKLRIAVDAAKQLADDRLP